MTTAEAPARNSHETRWAAHLGLRYERRGARSVLAKRSHAGPLVVQKSLYPEGDAVCQNIIVHPPAGIVGGDALSIDVRVGSGACAQLTTPGAAKWYRSAGLTARQAVALRAESGALLEWLPQETIVFDGAIAQLDMTVDLAGDSAFLGWDIVCLGRAASGERFTRGSWRQRIEIVREDEPVFIERANFDGGAGLLASAVGLNCAPVFGTFLAACVAVPDSTLNACRGIAPVVGQGAVTRMRNMIVARYRGTSAEAARGYFARLWGIARPALVGRNAVTPRIWNT